LRFDEIVNLTANRMGGIPDSWNWKNTFGLMLPVSWGLIYGYVVIFIAGEIEKPRVNILQSQILTTLISGFFMVWIVLGYSRMLGWEGMHAVAWLAEKGGESLKLPFNLHYLNIAAFLSGFQHGFGILLGFVFIASNWLWIVFSYIAWSRAAMAWGKDGIGPRWFIMNPKGSGQPVYLLLTMLLISQIALLFFSMNSGVLHSFSVGVMQLLSVFAFTALAAIILPYSRKAKPIWNLSPYRFWTLGKIPIVTIAGTLSLLLTGLLMIGFFINDEFEELHLWWVIINITVWISGGLWYLMWKKIQSRRGFDLSKTFSEMPPE
jgi:amino acid transporter